MKTQKILTEMHLKKKGNVCDIKAETDLKDRQKELDN